MLRFRTFATVLASCAVLAACGGGGNSGDTYASTGLQVAMSPQAVSMVAGQTIPMRITGGLGPYYVQSSNPRVLPAPGKIDNLHAANFTLTTGEVHQTETVTITVTDNTGKSAKADVTVKAVTFAVSPSALTLAANKSQTFRLFGGRAPFLITSTRPDALVVDTSKLAATKEFTVLANDATAQVNDITVSVVDATGAAVIATLSITPNQFQLFTSVRTTPSNSGGGATPVSAIGAGQRGLVEIQIDNNYAIPRTLTVQRLSGDFTIDGANSEGSIQSEVDSNRVALASVTAALAAVTQTGTLRVIDNATGKFVDHAFRIAGLTLSTSPSSLTVVSTLDTCTAGSVGVLQVMGGLPPYSIVSGAPSIVSPAHGSVSQSGGSVTLNATGVCTGANQVSLTVTDAVGAKSVISFISSPKPTVTPPTTKS